MTDVRSDLEQLITANPHTCGAGELAALVRCGRQVEAFVSSVLAQVAFRADQLAESKRSAPADDLLRNNGRSSVRDARSHATRGATMCQLPALGHKLAAGEVSPEHLDAARQAQQGLTEAERARFASLAPELADAAATSSPEDFRVYCRRQAEAITSDRGESRLERMRRDSRVRTWIDAGSGMYRLSGQLDPIRGATVLDALGTLTDRLVAEASADPGAAGLGFAPLPGHAIERDQYAAQALTLLSESALGAAARPSITVITDSQTLAHGYHEHTVAETSDGAPVPPSTLGRLCCDAVFRFIGVDPFTESLDVGRRHRLATPAQRAALGAIHSSCFVDDCHTPFDQCDIHHILEWEAGGPTDIANLVPICRRHHHLVHEGGWSIQHCTTAPWALHLVDAVGTRRSTGRPTRLSEWISHRRRTRSGADAPPGMREPSNN